ncbi:hypothetical protein Q1695_009553 [Nippostrongylus brasiliensis]|nr:hypothetical protein Q1695_009553 [Nippostrongylus brasiliensis]
MDKDLPKQRKLDDAIRETEVLLGRTQETISNLMILQVDIEQAAKQEAAETEPQNAKLAPIPIPKFKGDIWEWDTFWTSFNYNVHSKNIDEYCKLHYLLEALQGEALQLAKQFEISGSTYKLVLAHLKEKYGDKQALVDCLPRRLQSTESRSSSLDDQMTLCEQLRSIVSHLKLKKEHIDNTFLQKQLLAKFSVDIQRHILREKTRNEGMEWNTMKMLTTAREFIKEELQITQQTEFGKHNHERTENLHSEAPKAVRRQLQPCFYCRKVGHIPKNCDEFSTYSQRVQIMDTRKLCRNCGVDDHIASKCPRGNCRKCGIHGHHTSICKKMFESPEPMRQPRESKQVQKTVAKSTPPPSKPLTRANTVLSNQPANNHLHPDTILCTQGNSKTMILAGQAQVLNPTTGRLEPIFVMLDTGADRSFITNELANRLQLSDVNSKRLTINAFGPTAPITETCGITVLKMWDAAGQPHNFNVTRIDKVTDALQRNRLCIEDK